MSSSRMPSGDRLEYVHYPDTGCLASPSCLNCPLETCILDMEQTCASSRDREIYQAYCEQGSDVRALSARFGLSRRSIHRVVQSMR